MSCNFSNKIHRAIPNLNNIKDDLAQDMGMFAKLRLSINEIHKETSAWGFDYPLYDIKTIKEYDPLKGYHTRFEFVEYKKNMELYERHLEKAKQEEYNTKTFARKILDSILSVGDSVSSSINYAGDLFDLFLGHITTHDDIGKGFNEFVEGAVKKGRFIVFEDPTNYVDENKEFSADYSLYVKHKEALLQELKKQRDLLTRTDRDSKAYTKLNQSIKYLEQEQKHWDAAKENSAFIYYSILSEIEFLKDIMKSSQNKDQDLISLFDKNLFTTRLKQLEDMLLSRDHAKENDGELNLVLQNFAKTLTPDALSHLRNEIDELRGAYNAKSTEIIISAILESDLAKEQKAYAIAEGEEDKWDEYVQHVTDLINGRLNKKLDGDGHFGKFLLGAGSYDSPLTQVIKVYQDINMAKEKGVTQGWRSKLVNSAQKLKEKVGDLSDFLFAKDMFGVRINKLISYINLSFGSIQRNIKEASKGIYTAPEHDKEKAWLNWMRLLKENTELVDLRKVQKFVDKYKGRAEYSKYFTFTEEEMLDYERRQIERMGHTAWSLELEEAEKMFTYFELENQEDSIDKENYNPLAFIEHFYSENWDNVPSFGTKPAKYFRYIPKDSDHYNKDFVKYEEEYGSDFVDFYVNAKKLIDYTQSTARAEGYKMNVNDILNLEENAYDEAMKELSAFGRLYEKIKQFFRDMIFRYYDVDLENPNNNVDYKSHFRHHFNNYGKRQRDEMIKVLKTKSISELISIARSQGINIEEELIDDTKFFRNRLAESIAIDRSNQVSSTDIVKRILYGADTAEGANWRRATSGLVGMVKDVAMFKELKNTVDHVRAWERTNIFQSGYGNFEKFNELERKKLNWMFKFYSKHDKIMKEFWEKERYNIDSSLKSAMSFHIGGWTYYKKANENKFYKKKKLKDGNAITEEVSIEEFKDKRTAYIDHALSKLGRTMTVGGIVNGFTHSIFMNLLGLNYATGIVNRMAGYMQNNQAAASGLYGYNTDDLLRVRKRMFGGNTLKILGYNGSLRRWGEEDYSKGIALYTVHKFMSSLGLLENVASELSNMDQNMKSKGMEFLADLPLNLPEYKNQTEPFLAMAMNLKIERFVRDEDGNLTDEIDKDGGRLFDPDTLTLPFDPKTMKLLPEYRTPSNIANFEKMEADVNGVSRQNILISRYKDLKHRLHGNYEGTDKAMIQGTISGKSLIVFIKWLFENVNNQWGTSKTSLATARINIKGRKVVMMEHWPVLATHVGMLSIGIPLITGMSTPLLWPFIVIGGGYILTKGVVSHLRGEVDFGLKGSVNDLRVSLNYFVETLLRTFKTVTTSSTFGLLNPYKADFIEDYTMNSVDEKLDADTRKLISESAQEVADTMSVVIQFALISLVLKGLMVMLSGGGDDDDDEQGAELRADKLDIIERTMNKLINIKNQITLENAKWTNPSELWDSLTGFVLWNNAVKSIEAIQKAHERYSKNEIGVGELTQKYLTHGVGFPFGFPRKLGEVIFLDGNYIMDDKVYKEEGYLDSFIKHRAYEQEGSLRRDEWERKEKQDVRTKHRELATNLLTKHLTKKYKGSPTTAIDKERKNILGQLEKENEIEKGVVDWENINTVVKEGIKNNEY